MSPARRRFTLAHELAHVLLGHGGFRRRVHDERADHDEERLCDAVAAALLMPREAVQKLGAKPLTYDGIRQFASHWEVSLSALICRLDEVSHQLVVMLTLDKTPTGWVSVRALGSRPAPLRPLLSSPTRAAVDALRDEPSTLPLLARFGAYAYTGRAEGYSKPMGSRRAATLIVTSIRRAPEHDE